MKIIAVVDNKKRLIEATTDEIAKLFGKQSAAGGVYSPAHYLSSESLEVGTEINVDAAYKYIQWIYRHRDRFAALAKQMREHADSIDEFPAIFKSLSIPEKPE